MDMDIDDLEAPGQVQSRRTRFKPKPKSEQPHVSNSNLIPPVKHEPAIDFGGIVKGELEILDPPTDAVKMDTDTDPKPDPIEDPIQEDPMEKDGDDGDEDHVVREIDVYLTPNLDPTTQLYVMQYPLKACWRPYEFDDQCQEVRIKPDASNIEIDLSVDVDSKNYDKDNNRVSMSKQVLTSSGKLPCRSGYAVGVLIGNKLHLNPVCSAMQFRPSLRHLRDADVVMEEKPAKTQLEASGDDWIRLRYNGARSDASVEYMHKMMAVAEDSQIQFSMSSGEYVESFCPRLPNRQSGPSRSELLKQPIEERFKAWICETGPMHRFKALKYLAPDESDEGVLVILKKLCCLVQGLWVPKSSLLKLEGVEALVRDYGLYLFSKSHRISYNDIPKKMKLKSAMEDVLKVFAVRRPDLKDWKFKQPRDVSFVQSFPDINKEQEEAWAVRGEKLYIQIYGKDPPKIDTTSTATPEPKIDMTSTATPAPKANAVKSVPQATIRTTPLVKTVISDKSREGLLKAIEKLLHTHKVCTFQRLGQLLRGTGLEASLPPESELRGIMKEVAIDIHGVFVSKTTPEHSYDGLRRTVIDLLIVEGPNAKLRKAAIVEAGKRRLNRADIPTIEYNKVMHEFCVSRGSVWMLKPGDGSPD